MIDYNKGGNEVAAAWFEYLKHLGDSKKARVVDFAAGWNARKAMDEKRLMTEVRLDIVATHIATIMTQTHGGMHTVYSPGKGIAIKVMAKSPTEYYVDDKMVGNRYGAVQEYIRILKEHSPQITLE